MADRRISKRLMDKVMSTCVTPACLYGTETLAMSEREQQRLQMYENNWVRKGKRTGRGTGAVEGRLAKERIESVKSKY